MKRGKKLKDIKSPVVVGVDLAGKHEPKAADAVKITAEEAIAQQAVDRHTVCICCHEPSPDTFVAYAWQCRECFENCDGVCKKAAKV